MTPEGVVVLLHVEIQEREIHLERDPFDPPRVLLHDRLRPTVPRERGTLGEGRGHKSGRHPPAAAPPHGSPRLTLPHGCAILGPYSSASFPQGEVVDRT